MHLYSYSQMAYLKHLCPSCKSGGSNVMSCHWRLLDFTFSCTARHVARRERRWLCLCREVAGFHGPWTVLLHQPGLSDGRQHERQRGNGRRRRKPISVSLVSSIIRHSQYNGRIKIEEGMVALQYKTARSTICPSKWCRNYPNHFLTSHPSVFPIHGPSYNFQRPATYLECIALVWVTR